MSGWTTEKTCIVCNTVFIVDDHHVKSKTCSKACWKEHRRQLDKKYRAKPERKAYQKAYAQSPKRKAYEKSERRLAQYRARSKQRRLDPAYKERRKKYDEHYKATHQYRERIKRFNSSPARQAYMKKYLKSDKRREWLKNCPLQTKLAMRLRQRLAVAIRKGRKGGSAVNDLGCSLDQFRAYIESQFQPGMNWSNWGRGKGCWNLDHFLPLASADLTNLEHCAVVLHYTNYRPLWFEDNLRKSASEQPWWDYMLGKAA